MAKGNTIRKERRGRVPVNASRPRTRGQRGKLHDPATNTAELTAQLRAMGLYAAPTLGDGNCLFRALSDQMYGTADKHLPLRQEICAYMAAHKSRFEAFVDDDRSWDQHISTMSKSGTYGGHLELTAFAQLKVVNVKVVQPGLVYVIEGSKTEVGGASGCAAGASAVVGEEMTSKERRKARKERMKKKSEEKDDDEDDDDDDDSGGSDPFPATVYVAYHDWEHFSSVRNLTGPHTGPPSVCEVPEPETSSLPSPPPSKPAKSSRKQPTTQQPTPESSSPSPPPPSRSPKRAIDEDDEEEDEGRKRGRRGTITRHALEDEDDDGEGAESTGVSASAESFISDAPPPPPPEPEPEPEKLTKRQRKSLGVPKSKAARASVGKTRAKAPVSAKASASTKVTAAASKASKSNSTPTTPAKRETRSATKAYRDAGKVRDLGTGEWLDNGTGRLDVRGFRELRI